MHTRARLIYIYLTWLILVRTPLILVNPSLYTSPHVHTPRRGRIDRRVTGLKCEEK